MLFAGHGILKDGMQVMLYNEYDQATGFYKLLKAEQKIRIWAEIFPNFYGIGIFACCRQLWDPELMTGFISKDEKEGKIALVMPERIKRYKLQLDFLKQQIEAFNKEQEFFHEYIKEYKEMRNKEEESKKI